MLDELPKMDHSEIKLIHFDSAYFLPESIPLIHIDPSDKDTFYNGIGFAHLRRVFTNETNLVELVRLVKCVPVSCNVCDSFFSDIQEVIRHVFSQAHSDKFMKVRGSISQMDFSFWARLLKTFPKEREDASNELQRRQLAQMASKLDLHSRLKHFTVEVNSAEDQIACVSHFVQSCAVSCERVVIYCKDSSERDCITQLISKSETATVTSLPFAWTEQGTMWKVSLDPMVDCSSLSECAVFLRPPMDSHSTGSLTAFCAFQLCSPRVKSSMMVLCGKEEKESFQSFVKKFMLPNVNPLPIYDNTLMKFFIGTKPEEKKQSTVEQSITAPPADSDPTPLPPPTDPPIRPMIKAIRRLKPTVSPVPIDAPSEPAVAQSSIAVKSPAPSVPLVTVPPVFALPSISVELKTTTGTSGGHEDAGSGTAPSSTVPSPSVCSAQDLKTSMAELQRIAKHTSQELRRIQRNPNAPDLCERLEEMEEQMRHHEQLMEVVKSQIEETEKDQRRMSRTMTTIDGLKKNGDDMREVLRESISAAQKNTVSGRSTVVHSPSTVHRKKEVKARRVVHSVKVYCVEVERREEERGGKERKSRRAERKEKKWPVIFTPFDEETGNTVEELIRMLSENHICPEL